MKSTLIVTILACLSLLGVIGFVAYKGLKPTAVTKKSVASSQQSSKSPVPKNGSDSVTLGASTNKASDTIPLGESAPSTQSTSQPQLLDPSQFGQYDEYKTGDKYLRIDAKLGTGAEAVTGKKVAVLYKGWLTNGQVFDQSRPNEKGELQPFVFTPGAKEVIGGWEEGILGMKVGGTRRLVLPPVAAYGEQGHDPIPPNAVLVFDIQLLEVEK